MNTEPTPTTSLKRIGLIGAGAFGTAALAIGLSGVAGAQDDDPTLEDPAPADDSTDTTDSEDRPTREERQQARLDQLIEDGVITQEQADDLQSVRDAIRADREAQRAEKLQGIADVIGVTVEELEAAKEAGTTLAELAGDNLPALVDHLVAEATERIEAGVADGRITQERADEKLDGLAERIESRLENGGGLGGHGHRGRGHRGHRGFGGGGFGGADNAPAAAEVSAA